MKKHSWLPKKEKIKIKGNRRHVKDGMPVFIPLKRWPNDLSIRGDMQSECCDCGLNHIYTFTVVKPSSDEWLLIRRAYRVAKPEKKR